MRTPLFPRRVAAAAGIVLLSLSSGLACAQPAAATVQALSIPCGNTTCDAEIRRPPGVARPPVIVMAHGFGALRDWGLTPFADRFVQAGFAVVRFDYRGFGRSGGQPRRVVDGPAHVDDWVSAIDAVAARLDVDGTRLGIWGSSYSGGQVLVAASRRPQVVKAVSSQVPFVHGLSSALRYPIRHQPAAMWMAIRDAVRGDGEEPVYMPIISADGGTAALICDECVEGYSKLVPKGQEAENKVAARFLFSLPFFYPIDSAPKVQAPTLVIAAERDGLIPIQKVRDTAKALPRGEYVELPGAHHFSPYQGPVFEQVVARQTAFFRQHLAR